ncbi:MAG: AMP-binding protein, partial [Candidatus Zixiibacteriota bacterium]
MPLLNEKDFRLTETIHGAILHTCRRLPGKPAMVGQGGAGKSYTFEEIGNLVGRIAGGLRKKGCFKGNRVAIISDNCPEWGISYLSILCAGCIVVPLDVSLKPNELTRFLRVSGVKTLVCSPRWEKDAIEMIALNDLPVDTVTMNFEEGCTLKTLAESESYMDTNISPRDTAVIIYTSGTTGDPKGVILTHNNILRNIDSIVKSLMIYQEDNLLSVLPLHHTFEATVGFLFPMCTGLTVIYARSLKSRDLLADIQNNNITFMIGVPLLFEKIYAAINKKISELPPIKRLLFNTLYSASRVGWKLKRRLGVKLFRDLRSRAGLASIRLMVSGGAALPPRVAEWYNMIGFIFLGGYGLTECAPVVSFNRPDEVNFDSVGRPLPGIDVKIDQPAADGIGEIVVRGENNTPGYID